MSAMIRRDSSGIYVFNEAGIQVASDCDGDIAQFGRWLLDIRAAGHHDGRVAHIGGGLCLLAQMMGPAYEHVVYEIAPELSEFCSPPHQFVPGDWRDTIDGLYDVIVYDIGGAVPRKELSAFLAPGGIILPMGVASEP